MSADEMTTAAPRPGTNASIERRVERLELQQDEMQKQLNIVSTDVLLVKKEQEHQRELMTARFGSVDKALEALTAKFDNFTTTVNAAFSDEAASPSGRQTQEAFKRIEGAYTELKGEVSEVRSLAQSSRDWIIRAGGVVALAIFLVTLFAPLIRNIFEAIR